jgi:hypothetical protein
VAIWVTLCDPNDHFFDHWGIPLFFFVGEFYFFISKMVLSARHKRLIGVIISLFVLTFGLGLYIFVLIHEHHVWSILMNCLLLFFMVITPACCYGYNINDDVQFLIRDGITDEQTFLNCRDMGYGISIVLYTLTFVLPTVAWYASNGRSPTWIGASLLYFGNTCIMSSFSGFIKIKLNL